MFRPWLCRNFEVNEDAAILASMLVNTNALPPKILTWATEKNDKPPRRPSSTNRCQLPRQRVEPDFIL